MLPCFWQQWEKDILVTRVLLQEKAKLLYEQLFPDATTPFSASTGFIKWVLDYPNPDYLYPDTWTSAHVAMISVPVGKIRYGHWSCATGESKAFVRTTFLNTTMLFPSSMGFSSQFTISELAERSRERCSTLYYTVLQHGNLQGRISSTFLSFNQFHMID